ncbi:MAG: branched-chain amino acid ABC transporter permease [Candidatus Caldarchaeum sp.]
MRKFFSRSITLWIVLLVVAFTLGFFAAPYYTSLLIFLFIYAALALSYDILGGFLGYMNLGHIIFYGLGAYVFAITLNNLSLMLGSDLLLLSMFTAIIASVAVGAGVAALLSYPLFRVKGFYFAVATLGLISLVNIVISSPEMSLISGGFSGINLVSDVARESNSQNAYLLAMTTLVLTGLVHVSINRSSFRNIFSCVKEDEQASECSGINPFRYKQVAFIISAALASLAGTAYMWFQTYTNPRLAFAIELAFLPIIIALLGGSGTLVGPLIGSIIFTVVYQLLLVNLPSLTKLIIGLVLIAVGVGASSGVVGLIRSVARLRRKTYEASPSY